MKTVKTIYDTIIIGAGPSGVQAGIYLLRANKKVLFFHAPNIGALQSAGVIENFYGQTKISGKELYDIGISSVKNLGAQIKESLVTYIEYDFENELYIVCDNNIKVKAKTLILAMGKQIQNKSSYKLNATEKISYCATCDGFFYRNKKLAIIGNSEYTLSEYNHLLNVASDITLITNNVEISSELKDIKNVINKEIVSINQTKDNNVKITFKDKSSEIFEGVFIAEGHFGTSALSSTLGVYSENGFIVVNEKMSTNVKGVYACGDIIGGTFQIAKATCDGMATGLSVISYLNGKN